MAHLQKTNNLHDWLIIVNPNAGKGNGKKEWQNISDAMQRSGVHFKHVFTQHRNHAENFVKDEINNGYKKVIVVGGDGTLNEVINGIFNQKRFPTHEIQIGMITVGSGNDWARMYNIPRHYKEAIETIVAGDTFVQDAGKVTYHVGSAKRTRYFINMAGMGYDALVAQKTNKMKEKGRGGAIFYFYNLFLGLFQYRKKHFEIVLDQHPVYNDKVFSMSIGICKYSGGGMMQLPNAIPDDGLFDLTIFNRKAGKADVFRHIKKLYNGTIINLPIVDTFTGKHVTVCGRPADDILLETDGELLGHSPLSFEIIPKSIKVITGKDWKKQMSK